MTGRTARRNQIAAVALESQMAGITCGAVPAPLSGGYPCGMIETVQQESLTERG
jgi:hypothetical protein